MKKRASLSLSVNAIVVLILAIVMLGLGLGFIRGMFGKVSTQVEEQIPEPEPPIPTASNPITLSRESIITHAGSKGMIKVSAYNPTDQPWSNVKPTIGCTTTDLTINEQSANQKNVEQGEFATFNLLFAFTIESPTPNTYLCQVSMQGYEKDIAIKITK